MVGCPVYARLRRPRSPHPLPRPPRRPRFRADADGEPVSHVQPVAVGAVGEPEPAGPHGQRLAVAVAGRPRVAAFFNVGNTMMRGASISPGSRSGRWRSGSAAPERSGFLLVALETALAFVAGRRVDEVVALCEDTYDEVMAGADLFASPRAVGEHVERSVPLALLILGSRTFQSKAVRHGRRRELINRL